MPSQLRPLQTLVSPFSRPGRRLCRVASSSNRRRQKAFNWLRWRRGVNEEARRHLEARRPLQRARLTPLVRTGPRYRCGRST